MSFRFNKQSIEDCEQGVRNKILKTAKNVKMLEEISDAVIKDIQLNARRGKNPETQERFKPLSKKWITLRDRLQATNTVTDVFKPNRSNLSLTGQLIDSIKSKFNAFKITFYFDGIHNPYKLKNIYKNKMSTIGKPIKNEELAKYVQDVRPFFVIRKSLLPKLKVLVLKYIRKNL